MEQLLNLAIFLPLVGALAVAVVRQEKFSKVLSLGVSLLVFLLALLLFLNFRWEERGFQYVTKVDWIPSLGIAYHVGLDGMGVSLLLMTALVFLVAFLWSWKVEEKPNLYFALFLVLETACLGVFSALDLFLFYLFWEGMLIPMYFIIGMWGHDRKVYAAN
ncbi:MAG: proton-conducting transporter membrane subunit, partial [Aquificaceae bacterium]|nr:proton-conducting transporter membrane subunit [Aquificaceae bacterium]